MRRATSCANRTDEKRDIENDNSHIGMSEFGSRVTVNEVDTLRMERVRAQLTTNIRVFVSTYMYMLPLHFNTVQPITMKIGIYSRLPNY